VTGWLTGDRLLERTEHTFGCLTCNQAVAPHLDCTLACCCTKHVQWSAAWTTVCLRRMCACACGVALLGVLGSRVGQTLQWSVAYGPRMSVCVCVCLCVCVCVCVCLCLCVYVYTHIHTKKKGVAAKRRDIRLRANLVWIM